MIWFWFSLHAWKVSSSVNINITFLLPVMFTTPSLSFSSRLSVFSIPTLFSAQPSPSPFPSYALSSIVQHFLLWNFPWRGCLCMISLYSYCIRKIINEDIVMSQATFSKCLSIHLVFQYDRQMIPIENTEHGEVFCRSSSTLGTEKYSIQWAMSSTICFSVMQLWYAMMLVWELMM